MSTTFAYVRSENTAYEFDGYSQQAAAFMEGVKDRLGVAHGDIEFFSSERRQDAADLLDAYARGRDIGPNIVKVAV